MIIKKPKTKSGFTRLVDFLFRFYRPSKNAVLMLLVQTGDFSRNCFCVKKGQNQKLTTGFTLIEMLVYLSIFIVLVMAIVASLVYMSKSYRTLIERKILTSSAVTALNRLSFEIRQAVGVDAVNSLLNSDSSRLVLDSKKTDGSDTSYIFYLDGGVIKLQQDGLNPAVPEEGESLTLPGVVVNSFYVYRPVGTSTNAITIKMKATSGSKTGNFGLTSVIRSFK